MSIAPESGSLAIQRQAKVNFEPWMAGQTLATPVLPSTSGNRVSLYCTKMRVGLTASHVIASQVDDWIRASFALHRHADAGCISLINVVDEEGGKEGVTTDGREAGSSQEDGRKPHNEELESGLVVDVFEGNYG